MNLPHPKNSLQINPSSNHPKFSQLNKNSVHLNFQNSSQNLKRNVQKMNTMKKQDLSSKMKIIKEELPLDLLHQHRIKLVRKEKKKMIDSLHAQINKTNYYENCLREEHKMMHTLQSKVRRVEMVRFQRKKQLQQLSRLKESFRQSLYQEKLQSKRSIDQSKLNISKSLTENIYEKSLKADSVRKQRLQNVQLIQLTKNQVYLQRKEKNQNIKRQEKNASLNMTLIKQYKKSQVDQIKLRKLTRQLSQTQQIEKANKAIHRKVRKNLQNLKISREFSQSKIIAMKKSLGNRVFNRRFESCRNKSMTETSAEFEQGEFQEGGQKEYQSLHRW